MGELPAGFDIGHATDVGRVREANEDALLAAAAPEQDGQVLVAVADGMGGHNAGEVAAALAVESLARAFGQTGQTDQSRTAEPATSAAEPATRAGSADVLLAQAVDLANRTIWDATSADRAKEGMGTTLVCALVERSGDVTIANVGDSRAYVVADGQARLLTIDHTWVGEQVRSGQMTERDARRSPYRNLLTRSLGGSPHVQVDLFTGLRLRSGDALVLCSDGVTTYLDGGDLAKLLADSRTAQQAAERIVDMAVRRGGADNATAVVVRVQ